MNAHSQIAARKPLVHPGKAKLIAERDRKCAEAARSGLSWDDLGRASDRIYREYYDAVRALEGPLPADPQAAGCYDPVFDNTAASHSYFGRL